MCLKYDGIWLWNGNGGVFWKENVQNVHIHHITEYGKYEYVYMIINYYVYICIYI